jgi:exodeoxyribonuclease VII small subunit
MSSETPSELTFEQAYAQLEEILAQLESGDLTLDESVALYAQGQTLSRLCGEKLDAAELRVQQVMDDGTIKPLE